MRIIAAMALLMAFASFGVAQEQPTRSVAQPQPEQSQSAQENIPAITADSINVGTAVSNKTLEGQASSFASSVRVVYCLAKLNARQPANIKFVWYKGGNKVKDSKLFTVEASPTFTIWSAKGVSSGNWKVELVTEDGAVLSSAEFSVE